MRKFLIGLAVYAVALTTYGTALEIDKAEAGKTVRIYCVAKKAPTYHGTKVRCYNPGMWVYVPYWYARMIGTYPILLARSNDTCVGGKPKVVRTPGASSWRLVGQRCMKQGIG